MPKPAATPMDLVLEPGVDVDGVLDRLAQPGPQRAGTVDRGPSTTIERVFLDTFDGRLSRAGLVLDRTAAGPGQRPRLHCQGPSVGALSAETIARRADRLFVGDTAPGPLHDRLAGLIDVRVLLAKAKVRTRRTAVAIRNGDEKTVVRIAVEESTLLRGNEEPAPLSTRFVVTPVLGYDAAYAKVVRSLSRVPGLSVPSHTLAEEAVAAAGGSPLGISSKVDVDLRPGMRADVATLTVCRRLAEVVEANLPGTLTDLDTEFLHDLRVAIRRSRSLLREMKGVLEPDARARARVDLRWIQEVTGPTRDLDVMLLDWAKLSSAGTGGGEQALDPIHRELVARRDAAFKQMKALLRSRRFNEAWLDWQRFIDPPLPPRPDPRRPNAAVPIDVLAGKRVAAVYRDMVRDGRRIDDGSPPEALHDLRKRGKELRYLLELFGSLWPPEVVKPLVSTLKALQDVLGRFQDNQIQAGVLRSLGMDLAAAPGGPDALLALGPILDHLAQDQREARRSFAARFEPFAASATRLLVKATFAPPPPAEAAPPVPPATPAAPAAAEPRPTTKAKAKAKPKPKGKAAAARGKRR